MPDKERNPKLEFKTNIPIVLTLGKMFKQGESEYGPWYGYNMAVEGKDHTFFAKPALYEKIKDFQPGTVLQITFTEKKRDDGKAYHEWEVVEPLFDKKGEATPEPPPDPFVDAEANGKVREERREVMLQALMDAEKVASAFNALEIGLAPEFRLNREDIRAMAISYVIDWNRSYK